MRFLIVWPCPSSWIFSIREEYSPADLCRFFFPFKMLRHFGNSFCTKRHVSHDWVVAFQVALSWKTCRSAPPKRRRQRTGGAGPCLCVACHDPTRRFVLLRESPILRSHSSHWTIRHLHHLTTAAKQGNASRKIIVVHFRYDKRQSASKLAHRTRHGVKGTFLVLAVITRS